jgi:hypothetical protein
MPLLVVLPVVASTITLTDDARGWVTPNLPPPPDGGTVGQAAPNNGLDAGNSYLAGLSLGLGQFRDWFEFAIPTLSGDVVSATLALDQPAGTLLSGGLVVGGGHEGPPSSYLLYGLPAIPTGFADFTIGPMLGFTTLDASSNGTVVSIDLDAAALAAIGADRGGEFILGGIDSGEVLPPVCNLCGQDFDFANTTGAHVSLTLDIDPGADTAPEASTLTLSLAAAGVYLACRAARRVTRSLRERPDPTCPT